MAVVDGVEEARAVESIVDDISLGGVGSGKGEDVRSIWDGEVVDVKSGKGLSVDDTDSAVVDVTGAVVEYPSDGITTVGMGIIVSSPSPLLGAPP